MCTIYTITWISVLVWVSTVFSKNTLPEYIKVCKYNNETDRCIQSNIEYLKPYLLKGIPEMHIPPMDPLVIKEAAYDSNNIYLKTFDIKVYNMINFKTEYLHLNFKDRIFLMNVSNTVLDTEGEYYMKGNLGSLEITGNGAYTLNITNVKQQAQTYLEFVERNGKEHINIESYKSKLSMEKFNIRLKAVTPENPQLTEIINNALNEQGKELVEDILNTIYSHLLRTTLQEVFDLFPADVLFPREKIEM